MAMVETSVKTSTQSFASTFVAACRFSMYLSLCGRQFIPAGALLTLTLQVPHWHSRSEIMMQPAAQFVGPKTERKYDLQVESEVFESLHIFVLYAVTVSVTCKYV